MNGLSVLYFFLILLFSNLFTFIIYKYLKNISHIDNNSIFLSDGNNIVTSLGITFIFNFFLFFLLYYNFYNLKEYIADKIKVEYFLVFLVAYFFPFKPFGSLYSNFNLIMFCSTVSFVIFYNKYKLIKKN